MPLTSLLFILQTLSLTPVNFIRSVAHRMLFNLERCVKQCNGYLEWIWNDDNDIELEDERKTSLETTETQEKD